MRARDIEKLFSVSIPSMAPDGSRVVVAVSHPSLDADSDVGQLWSVPLDASGPARITRGSSDGSPQFAPNGSAIAFLRLTGKSAQLFAIPGAGGEAVQLTEAKLGVTSFAWSPDSQRIVYASRVPEQGRYGTVDGIEPGAEPARSIDRLNYKYNGAGYTIDKPSHLFLLTVPALDAEPSYEAAPHPDGSKPDSVTVPESVQLTGGDFTEHSPRFIGDRVAFVSSRHADRDTDLRDQLWAVSTAAPLGEPEALTDVPGSLSIERFEVAPNGALYFLAQELGPDGNDFVARNSALHSLIDGVATRLTDPENLDLTESAITIDGDRVLVSTGARGRRVLLAMRGEGEPVRLSSVVEIQGQAVGDGTVVVTYASPDTFGDVAVLRDGILEPLTDFSAALRETGLVEPVEIEVTARDGYPVHGWVASPAGEGPHPTLLMIHGGPYAQYGVHVFDETQVYVDAGYAVVYCNPRGSAGYGQAHGRAIRQAMGTLDYTDVLDFLDGAIATRDTLDATRLGILGGSYGGYLTAWVIGNDHRFRAAVVERGFLDPEAFVGSSDIGMMFSQQYNGTDHERVRAQSPQAVAGSVVTPTLVIHSEQDLRCPLGQAETYFATLRLGGVPAEMLIFPGENHELSRSGRPRHRLQRFEAILDWFGRHL